jgi:protein SCO1/2
LNRSAKSRAASDSILNGYGQVVDKRSNPNDPQGPLYHILRVFLIDREGRIRNISSSATLDPRLVLADVKTLLLEETKFSKQ